MFILSKMGDILVNMLKPEKALTMLDFEHKKIHEGKSFLITKTWTGVSSEANVGVVLDSPVGEHHIVFEVNFSNGGTFSIFEDVTSVDGTEIPKINHNRRSDMTCSMGVYDMDTVSDTGTSIYSITHASGSGPATNRALSVGRNEFILKPEVKYLFRATSGAAGSTINLIINWYMP